MDSAVFDDGHQLAQVFGNDATTALALRESVFGFELEICGRSRS